MSDLNHLLSTSALLRRAEADLCRYRFAARWSRAYERWVVILCLATVAGAFLAVAAGAGEAKPGDLPAKFLGKDVGEAVGDMPATFLGKDAGQPAPVPAPAPAPGFLQEMLDLSWGQLNPLHVGPAHAEYGDRDQHNGTTGGIFGAADRRVDQTIAQYQSGSIGRAVATFWRDLFQRGNLYNPSSPGNIPGLFLSGQPGGPGTRIPAHFLSSTACCNAPTGFVADQFSGGSWDGKGFGHWSW
jgi:hypothetical protein